PILFDLRDVSVAALSAQPTLATVVEALLAGAPEAGEISAEQGLAEIDAGNCLGIFDGLGEVLVHLSPDDGQLFIRALWRAIDAVTRPQRPWPVPDAADPGAGAGAGAAGAAERSAAGAAKTGAAETAGVGAAETGGAARPTRLLLTCRTH